MYFVVRNKKILSEFHSYSRGRLNMRKRAQEIAKSVGAYSHIVKGCDAFPVAFQFRSPPSGWVRTLKSKFDDAYKPDRRTTIGKGVVKILIQLSADVAELSRAKLDEASGFFNYILIDDALHDGPGFRLLDNGTLIMHIHSGVWNHPSYQRPSGLEEITLERLIELKGEGK